MYYKIMAYTVYMHRNKTNGKVYIGQTSVSVEERWKKGKGYHHNAHFQSAIKKYGWDGFEHLILYDGLTKEQACKLEQKLIAEYNRKPSPRKGAIVSAESREKMRLAKLGKPQNQETKEKRSKSQWKPVICVETGEIFESVKAATAHFGLKKDRISSAIRKGRKVNGFTWQFLRECEKNGNQKSNDT